MDNQLEKVFKNFSARHDLKSEVFLQSKIMTQIMASQAKQVKLRAVASRIVGALSFIALFPIIINLFSQLQSSGFWNYFSLLFTDTGTVAIYWKELALSLVEALPIFGITLATFLLLALFVSLKFININHLSNKLEVNKKYEFKF